MSDLQRITERYRLDKLIHASDTASVFRATDPRSGQTVALKSIRKLPEGARRDDRATFESAGRALQGCRHPGLPCLLDFGFTAAGGAFLVTDYLPGATLDLLAGSAPSRVLPLLLPVIDVLEELDRHQLAHRNLRADNLLVVPSAAAAAREASEEIKLLGWGGATLAAGEEGRRADLRAFAELACAMIGAEVQRAPSLVVNMPAAAGDQLANAPELEILLSLLLQPSGPAPASLYAELRRAFSHAIYGHAAAARRGTVAAAQAAAKVSKMANAATRADVANAANAANVAPAAEAAPARETRERPQAVDLDETRALLADVTMAVPRERLLGALEPRPAAGASPAAAGAPGSAAASAAGFAALGAPGPAALGEASAPGEGPASRELRLVGAAPPPTAAATVRTETLPSFLPADLGGPAAGAGGPGSGQSGAVLRFPPLAPIAPVAPAAAGGANGMDAAEREGGADRAGREDAGAELATPAHGAEVNGAEVSGAEGHGADVEGTEAHGADVTAPAHGADFEEPAATVGAAAGGVAGPGRVPGPLPPAEAWGAAAQAGSVAPAGAPRPPAPAPRSRQRYPGRGTGTASRKALVGAGIAVLAVAATLVVAWLRPPQRPARPAAAAGRPAPQPAAAATTRPAAAVRDAAVPAPTVAAAAIVSQPAALDPRLREAGELLARGDAAAARRALAQITGEQQAAFGAADRDSFDRLNDALAADRRAQIAADLSAGMRRGDMRRLNAALTAARRQPDLSPDLRRDLDRARRAVDLESRLNQLDRVQNPQEVLRAAAELLALLPRYGRAGALREQAAVTIEEQAEAALAAGDSERAASLGAGLRQLWPDRAGLQERLERIETQRREGERLEGVLASAARAEAAGQPLQGLELLGTASPAGRFRERFQKQRERLNQLLARLDAAPPSIALRAGYKLEYDKGERIAVPLRITDDLAVKSAECWVRPEGAGTYQPVPVRHLAGADYEVDIPPEVHQNRPVELYATAADNSGHQAQLGSRDRPLRVKRRNWIEKIFTGKETG